MSFLVAMKFLNQYIKKKNYKNVKNNIDSSNTKAYVLGFSFALTHTAYDNVDIKGAVKKTFKPSFTGIVTIPNDKEKVNILYYNVCFFCFYFCSGCWSFCSGS